MVYRVTLLQNDSIRPILAELQEFGPSSVYSQQRLPVPPFSHELRQTFPYDEAVGEDHETVGTHRISRGVVHITVQKMIVLEAMARNVATHRPQLTIKLCLSSLGNCVCMCIVCVCVAYVCVSQGVGVT